MLEIFASRFQSLRMNLARRWLFEKVSRKNTPLAQRGFLLEKATQMGLSHIEETLGFLDKIVLEREASTPFDPKSPFFKNLFKNDDLFESGSPLLEFILQKEILGLVKNYLPFDPVLRAAGLWLTVADDRPAIETQLFHLDGDDAFNVKIYLFVNDVTPKNGPFCFMPTNLVNGASSERPRAKGTTRISDERVLKFGEPVFGLGKRGTFMMADTCFGFHKQQKPKEGRRIMFMAQFSSRRPYYPIEIKVPQGFSVPEKFRPYLIV